MLGNRTYKGTGVIFDLVTKLFLNFDLHKEFIEQGCHSLLRIKHVIFQLYWYKLNNNRQIFNSNTNEICVVILISNVRFRGEVVCTVCHWCFSLRLSNIRSSGYTEHHGRLRKQHFTSHIIGITLSKITHFWFPIYNTSTFQKLKKSQFDWRRLKFRSLFRFLQNCLCTKMLHFISSQFSTRILLLSVSSLFHHMLDIKAVCSSFISMLSWDGNFAISVLNTDFQ